MCMSPEEEYEQFVRDAGGTKPIRRIVVANNGMAATKFIMSIRNWLFTNFGDDRLIHIVAMATPEARASRTATVGSAGLCALNFGGARGFAGYEGPCCGDRRCRHLL